MGDLAGTRTALRVRFDIAANRPQSYRRPGDDVRVADPLPGREELTAEIRLQMRLQDTKSRGPELTEGLVGSRLQFSIEQGLIGLGWAKNKGDS